MIDLVLWIIAACEIIRAVQNAAQLRMLQGDKTRQDIVIKKHELVDKMLDDLIKEFEGETGNEYAAKRADIEPFDEASQHNAN